MERAAAYHYGSATEAVVKDVEGRVQSGRRALSAAAAGSDGFLYKTGGMKEKAEAGGLAGRMCAGGITL